MARDQSHLLDPESRLEQAAGPFMAHVVEVQVLDPQLLASPGERGANRFVIVGEDPVVVVGPDRALFLN